MKKIIFIFLSLLFIKLHSQNNFNCTSHTKYEELSKNDSQFKINQELLEAETQQYIVNKVGIRFAPYAPKSKIVILVKAGNIFINIQFNDSYFA